MSRYRATPWRRRDNVNEPLTITTEEVVKELERLGYERMAGFVKRLGDGVAKANIEKDRVARSLEDAIARLRKYEPAEPARQPSYLRRPSSESDG